MTWRKPMAMPTMRPAASTTTHRGRVAAGAGGACFCMKRLLLLEIRAGRSLRILPAAAVLSQTHPCEDEREFLTPPMTYSHGCVGAFPGSQNAVVHSDGARQGRRDCGASRKA